MLTLALALQGQPVLVVGGGPVAARKVISLLAAGARVRVISPTLVPELETLHGAGQVEVALRPFASGDTAGALLVVVATGLPAVDAQVAEEARSTQRLVVVAAQPALGTAAFTAVVQRGPVQVAISTGGAVPALVGRLRRAIEQAVGPEYGRLAELLATLRQELRGMEGLDQTRRAAILAALAAGPELALLAAGQERAAEEALRRRMAEALARMDGE